MGLEALGEAVVRLVPSQLLQESPWAGVGVDHDEFGAGHVGEVPEMLGDQGRRQDGVGGAAGGQPGLVLLHLFEGLTEAFAGRGDLGQLFGAQLTAADQARFFYRLPGLVPKSHRKLALYLLSHVVSYQSWGIPAEARPRGWQVWFKGGWRGTDIGQLVHQVARLHKGDHTFSMAVFTDGDPSQGYGIETIAGVTVRVLAGG